MFGSLKKAISLSTVFLFVFLVSATFVNAQVVEKDADLDGLSDKAELQIYHTNINSPDTDNDGILDYQEVLDKTDPNNKDSNKILTMKSQEIPFMWYLGRIAGIAAFIMFTIVICFGLLMTSKAILKIPFLSAPNALDNHQLIATFMAFALVILHFVSFMFDNFMRLTLAEALVPFLLKRDLNSAMGVNINIPTALGVIALYLSLILILTSHFRKKFVSVKLWRKLHYLSFLFYILFLAHGFWTGTDSKEPWMLAIYIISLVSVISLILLRIFGKKYFLSSITPTKPVVSAEVPNANSI